MNQFDMSRELINRSNLYLSFRFLSPTSSSHKIKTVESLTHLLNSQTHDPRSDQVQVQSLTDNIL